MEKLVDLKDRHMVQGVPSEDMEQAWLFQWAARHGDPFLKMMFAIPNGGHRSKAQASFLKLTGVKAGVPDVFLPASMHRFNGLFIEMKKTFGGSLSVDQKKWKDDLTSCGYLAIVCKGFDEGKGSYLWIPWN